MTSAPYMPLYVADYLADTIHLTCGEHGAYLLLLMAMWRAGGRLPADDGRLARLARCEPSDWAEMRSNVLAFFHRRGGHITHKRLSVELAKYDYKVVQTKKAAKAGALKRANKNNDAPPADAERTLSEPEPEPEPIEREEANASLPGRPTPTPAVKRSDIEGIWSASPRVARERSSRADVERALRAAAHRGHEPLAVAAALARYYDSEAAKRDDYRAAKGVHRMIEVDRWRDWAGEVVAFPGAPAKSTEEQAAEDAAWRAYVRQRIEETSAHA